MDTVLIVDDEKNYPLVLSAVLAEEDIESLTAHSGREALQILDASDVDLVLTDMKMPGMDGIALLDEIKKRAPTLPVIMMTAHGTVEAAVDAMQKGAYNYILKPFDNDELMAQVQKALAIYQLSKDHQHLRNTVESRYSFGNLIGKSEPMHRVFDAIRKVAPANATVLIEGDSGTGKELVAKSIHFNSSRRNAPFIAVNCSALAESLLESELFGHEKGAFTGAAELKKGRFEIADRGTLFLDEIGELSQNLQVKLLRVIQEKMFERVGGTRSVSVNIRVIAATNKQLRDEVTHGRFREDLYYRLNVVNIALPPLHDRQEDIRLLAEHFIQKYAGERAIETPVSGISPEVERLFFQYHWPGNVRELENVIERAMILCNGDVITPEDLPIDFMTSPAQIRLLDGIPENAQLFTTLASVEKAMILRALEQAGHVQSRAAAILGIGKSGLSKKMQKYRIAAG